MKSNFWLPIRGWILLDIIRKKFTPTFIRHNYTEFITSGILFPIFVLVSDIIKVETFIIAYYNVIVLLSMLLIKLMSTCI